MPAVSVRPGLVSTPYLPEEPSKHCKIVVVWCTESHKQWPALMLSFCSAAFFFFAVGRRRRRRRQIQRQEPPTPHWGENNWAQVGAARPTCTRAELKTSCTCLLHYFGGAGRRSEVMPIDAMLD